MYPRVRWKGDRLAVVTQRRVFELCGVREGFHSIGGDQPGMLEPEYKEGVPLQRQHSICVGAGWGGWGSHAWGGLRQDFWILEQGDEGEHTGARWHSVRQRVVETKEGGE